MQQSLREEGKMQEEIRRSQVNEMDQNDHVQFHSEEEHSLPNVPEKSIENKTKENHHPYLGKNIDYNG